MVQRKLYGVVVRIPRRRLVRVTAEIRSQRAAGTVVNLPCRRDVLAVFSEWPARRLSRCQIGGIAQEQAQRWVAGVRFHEHEKPMRLRADVTRAEYCLGSQAALERQHVFLGVRNAIARRIVGNPCNGLELRPIDAGVGMARTRAPRSERNRKGLAAVLSGRGGNKRRGKERRRWAR